ncbi:hypothetical protein NL676_020535 [Syzygium grande]|nr:hypothetical protein NL676_020535 [Syzygium grande]
MSFLAHPDYPQEPPEGECALVQERYEEEEEERNRVCSSTAAPTPRPSRRAGNNCQPHGRRKLPFSSHPPMASNLKKRPCCSLLDHLYAATEACVWSQSSNGDNSFAGEGKLVTVLADFRL